MEPSPQTQSHPSRIKRCGGFVRKGMNGKLLSTAGARGAAVVSVRERENPKPGQHQKVPEQASDIALISKPLLVPRRGIETPWVIDYPRWPCRSRFSAAVFREQDSALDEPRV